MRLSRKRLESLVERIATLQDRPQAGWTRQSDGTLKCNPGALHLDYAASYGGFDLVEYVNDCGGESSLIGNTFGGRGRVKASEMEAWLLGALFALESKVSSHA